MATVKKTIEVVVCDACGHERSFYDHVRPCSNCQKDICEDHSTSIMLQVRSTGVAVDKLKVEWPEKDIVLCAACVIPVNEYLKELGFRSSEKADAANG